MEVRMMRKIIFFVGVGTTAILFSGCMSPEQALMEFQKKALSFLYPSPSPQRQANSASPSAQPSATTPSSLAKANLELLSEVFKVTFNETEIDDKSNFGELVHSLNQGASLEGIYRGLVSGSRYRTLETKSKAASPALIKVFAFEMAEIQNEMKDPTGFSQDTAKRAPSIDYPVGGDDSTGDSAVDSTPVANAPTQIVGEKIDKATRMNSLMQVFIGASSFTLKRVLADEAMKKMDELKDSRGELAQWYAKLAVRFCDVKVGDTQVDFGLPQRNLADFDFHFKFAQNMALDRVKWEVVNRYHRYLNALSEK